jgi:hypothetical protein
MMGAIGAAREEFPAALVIRRILLHHGEQIGQRFLRRVHLGDQVQFQAPGAKAAVIPGDDYRQQAWFQETNWFCLDCNG